MNLVYPACLLAGLAIGVPLTCVLSSWYDRRKNNVVDLDAERAQRRGTASLNVRTFGWKDNVKTLPRNGRGWSA